MSSTLANKAKGTDTGNKQQSLTNKQILDTKFKIPINKNGAYSLEKNEIVRKYEILEDKKKELREKLEYIRDIQVDFIENEIVKTKPMKIKDIFDLSIGSNSSCFTKTFIKSQFLYTVQVNR